MKHEIGRKKIKSQTETERERGIKVLMELSIRETEMGWAKEGQLQRGISTLRARCNPLFFKGNPTHAHKRRGHRDGTDILFTVVHLPPGSKSSHNHITHSQRPPILQVQSHTHAFIFSFSLLLSYRHIGINI